TIKGLGFLGEKFDDEKLETILRRIAGIVTEFSPFAIRFRGLGMFPTSIHVKVEDPTDQLRMMNKRISQELGSEIDTSEYDRDAYVPHVTLATFATKEAEELISKVNSPALKNFEFSECTVFEVEAIGARMFLALGPEELQDGAFGYLRSFQLGEFKPRTRVN
ncbi:MAG: 2'-5' RNA ligase family protein, partial [Nitrososphaerales archaeon]